VSSIADQTELELIESILLLYTRDARTAHAIAAHLAFKLTRRRKIIRERRRQRAT
jgi:hypothetical protein